MGQPSAVESGAEALSHRIDERTFPARVASNGQPSIDSESTSSTRARAGVKWHQVHVTLLDPSLEPLRECRWLWQSRGKPDSLALLCGVLTRFAFENESLGDPMGVNPGPDAKLIRSESVEIPCRAETQKVHEVLRIKYVVRGPFR